jgi:probable HAF family extracellular repeat protein
MAGVVAGIAVAMMCCGGAVQASDPPADPPALSAQNAHMAQYSVTDLGTLPGGNFSSAGSISNTGVISGSSVGSDGFSHAVLWVAGKIVDISKPGLGGDNSGALGTIPDGMVAGTAESADADPFNENFCDLFSGLDCLPYVWANGQMTALPLLGGNNGQGGPVNSNGQVVGWAETATQDPDCTETPAMAAEGVGPQVLDFEAVLWNATTGQLRQLNPLPGDTVAMAFWVNDHGQAVGTSGSCANTYGPPVAAGPHAVLWDADGSVHDLGNLGGTANPDLLGDGNIAFAINDEEQVTGTSALPGSPSTAFHAFLWTQASGMRDLGTVCNQDGTCDVISAGLGINDLGVVVGSSLNGPPFAPDTASRAIVWKNGVMTDLNAVVPANTPLYLLNAFGVNNAGQIVGIAFDPNTNEVHAFVANPIAGGGGPAARGETKAPKIPSSVRQFIMRHGIR